MPDYNLNIIVPGISTEGLFHGDGLFDDDGAFDGVSLECKVNLKIIKFLMACHYVAPTFHAEAEKVGQAVHAKADALVTATSEHLHQVVADTTQQNARVAKASTDYDLNLTSMEDGAVNLNAVTIGLINSREEDSGERQRSTETQINTQSSLALQQSTVQAIEASLENLPELLHVNREKQALMVDNERLLAEREGYASRTETLLSVLKEKSVENENLHVKVEGLEEKISGYASRMNTVLAFAKDKQLEVDELRKQLNEHTADKQSAGSTFSLNLFS